MQCSEVRMSMIVYIISLILVFPIWDGRIPKCLSMSYPSPPHRSAKYESSQGFWHDHNAVSSLPDPPSDELLRLIQEKPYRGGFEPAIEPDKPYSPRIVRGSIPEDLVGTLASNGAGRIRVGGRQYGHWFDGDGFLTALSLDGRTGEATFHAKYVRTTRFTAQQKLMNKLESTGDKRVTNPPLAFSGAWTSGGDGNWFENLFRVPTSPANTATMWLPPRDASDLPRLYALCEGGHPIQIHPKTLDTIRNETPFSSQDQRENVSSFFSAHFSRCPFSDHIYNHGFLIRPGPLRKEINIMKLNREGQLLKQAPSPLPFDTFVHDSSISQNFLVYFLSPYYIPDWSIFNSLAGIRPLGKCFTWDANMKSVLHVHSKNTLKLEWVIDLPHLTSMYHLVDVNEMDHERDDTIILVVRLLEHEPDTREELELQFSDQYRVQNPRIIPRIVEYRFSLEPDGISSFLSRTDVAPSAAGCEYPALNSAFAKQKRRFCWTNATSKQPAQTEWLDGIQKIDMEMGTASNVVTFGDGVYAGPPTFLGRKDAKTEDDGYIVTTVYRSFDHCSDVVILDAKTLDILCQMELDHHIPYHLHGDFVNKVTLDLNQ